jgi:hypothetical protein
MSARSRRILAVIAIVAAIALFVRMRTDGGTGADATPSAPARVQAVVPVPARTPAPATPARVEPVPPRMAEAAAVGGATPVHFLVRAPAFVAVHGTFDASVHVSAPAGLHRLRFAVGYDRRTLALTGVSAGDFAGRGGRSADFVTDEPSEGNVEVTFTLREGQALAGTGTVAVLHFEPRRRNASAITVSDLTALDTTGAVRFRADAPQSVTVRVE